MIEYLTRTEIARILRMDARTAIRRHELTPVGVVLSGSKKFNIYSVESVCAIANKTEHKN